MFGMMDILIILICSLHNAFMYLISHYTHKYEQLICVQNLILRKKTSYPPQTKYLSLSKSSTQFKYNPKSKQLK
jgi:hypothetical protein